jgi:hypothetical protein
MHNNTGFNITGDASLVNEKKRHCGRLSQGVTSAVASSLDALGLNLGRHAHSPTYENVKLAMAYSSKNW